MTTCVGEVEMRPSRSTTATNPPGAPSGTFTSTDVLRRTDGSAVTSSPSPSAPRNTTWSTTRMSFPPRTRKTEPTRRAPPSHTEAQSTREIAGAAAVETPNGTGLLDGTGVAPGVGVAVGTAWPPVEGAGAGFPADSAGNASAKTSAVPVIPYALTRARQRATEIPFGPKPSSRLRAGLRG